MLKTYSVQQPDKGVIYVVIAESCEQAAHAFAMTILRDSGVRTAVDVQFRPNGKLCLTRAGTERFWVTVNKTATVEVGGP